MNNALLKLLVQFRGFWGGEEGQDLVEYALLCTLISLTLISSISGISNAVNGVFSRISTSLG